jgi:uncharacterized integral membrane protein
MAVLTTHRQRGIQPLAVALRVMIVALTLATAAIHVTLGGTLFLMNAIGYTVLALAMVLPGPVARIRWLIRYALIGFAFVTIVGWLMFGARFDLAYLDKGIEVALIGLLLIESWVIDGGPLAVARRALRIAGSALR